VPGRGGNRGIPGTQAGGDTRGAGGLCLGPGGGLATPRLGSRGAAGRGAPARLIEDGAEQPRLARKGIDRDGAAGDREQSNPGRGRRGRRGPQPPGDAAQDRAVVRVAPGRTTGSSRISIRFGDAAHRGKVPGAAFYFFLLRISMTQAATFRPGFSCRHGARANRVMTISP